MARGRSKGKGAAAGDAEAAETDQEKAAPPTTDKDPATKEIPAARAKEIAGAGLRIAARIDYLIRREEQLVKKLTKVREDRKSSTRELIGLWGDLRTGQNPLPFPDDEPEETEPTRAPRSSGEPEKATEGGKPPLRLVGAADLGPGKADAKAYELRLGSGRMLRVDNVGPGEWNGFLDGVELCSSRSAQIAMHFLLGDQGIAPEAFDSFSWIPAKPKDEKAPHRDRWAADYKGRRLMVELVDGRFRAQCATGTDVAAWAKETYDSQADAKAKALSMAGYDSKDPRPKWGPVSEPKSAALANREVVLVVATLDGKELVVYQDGAAIRATVDGNFGGEHSSVDAAKDWAIFKVLGHKPKRGERPKWTVPAEGSADAEPMNVEYGTRVGNVVAVLRQAKPGLWDGRIDGRPHVTEMPLEDAKRLLEDDLRRLAPGAAIEWLRTQTENFLDDETRAAAR